MTASTADRDDRSAPPEVEAEFVDAPGPEAAKSAAAEPEKPKRRALWPLAASALAVVGIGSASYLGIIEFLKRRSVADTAAAAPVEGARDVSVSLPAASSAATEPVVASVPEARPNRGEATIPAADSAPGEAVPAAMPPAAATEQPSGIDPLAELQAQAELREAEESDGGVADAAPDSTAASAPSTEPAAAAPEGGGDAAAEIAALRTFFENETGRLAAELAAERARAEAQASEIAALRANVASLAQPTASSKPQASAAAETPAAAAPALRGDDRATLVLFALARAVESGKPYKAELARAEALAPGAPAIARLRVDAADGAPTLASLKASFPAEARRALAAEAGKGGGLMGRFSAGAAELVSVRPSGPMKGASPRAVLSRVEAALAADDVDAALREMRGLQGPARESMAAFVAEAERFSAARASLAELNDVLIDLAAG